jgi:hypothetical protein
MTMSPELWRRAVSALREARRTTIAGPLVDAFAVRAILRHIAGDSNTVRVVAPDEFAPYLRARLAERDGLLAAGPPFEYAVLRQTQIGALDAASIDLLRRDYSCLYANRLFVLFGPRSVAPAAPSAAVAAVAERLDTLSATSSSVDVRPISPLARTHAVLVTTFNRPAALARALPQIAVLGCPTLVIDDGTPPPAADRVREVAATCGATLLTLPSNRGLAAAINVGLDYLLADRSIEWISYFQDDVDVDAAALERLALVAQAADRPILTGYDADEHPAVREDAINGVRVKLKESSPAVHLHAHTDYWRSVLPIPTEYLGAPRPRWHASLEDYWIVNHAPASAGRRGVPVVCVPGLVRTFLWHHGDSTWNNPNEIEPPLGTDWSASQKRRT